MRTGIVAILAAGLLSMAASTRADQAGPASDEDAGHKAVLVYLNQLLDIMEANSVNRSRIKWPQVRPKVLAPAASARTIPEARLALMVSLMALGDEHSSIKLPDGTVLSGQMISCDAPPAPPPDLPASIGYLRVGSLLGDSEEEAARLAGQLQQHIRDEDRRQLDGWIVDLRGNYGGNLWAMLAGVGPLLGEGVSGYFGPPEGKDAQAWEYRNGVASCDGTPVITVHHPYRLRRPHPRVAVLTDVAVSSSGEGTAIAFRGRPETRSFGTPTCGVPTVIRGWTLRDGAELNLAAAYMVDRTHHRYDGPIAPDEAVDAEHVVQRAVEWLLERGVTASKTRTPR